MQRSIPTSLNVGSRSMTVNETFAKWAKSYSGCDGGNPERSIWLCGIEWGLSSEKYPDSDRGQDYLRYRLSLQRPAVPGRHPGRYRRRVQRGAPGRHDPGHSTPRCGTN